MKSKEREEIAVPSEPVEVPELKQYVNSVKELYESRVFCGKVTTAELLVSKKVTKCSQSKREKVWMISIGLNTEFNHSHTGLRNLLHTIKALACMNQHVLK